MAYSTQRDCEVAAGGMQRLVDLTNQEDADALDLNVLSTAQMEADTWIDSIAQRVREVPFIPCPPIIAKIAAKEAVYRLKQYKALTSEEDRALHAEREDWLMQLAAGKVIPGADPYPIGTGGGSPSTFERSSDTGFDCSKSSLKGFV